MNIQLNYMNIQLNYQESLTFHMDEHSVKLQESLTFHR